MIKTSTQVETQKPTSTTTLLSKSKSTTSTTKSTTATIEENGDILEDNLESELTTTTTKVPLIVEDENEQKVSVVSIDESESPEDNIISFLDDIDWDEICSDENKEFKDKEQICRIWFVTTTTVAMIDPVRTERSLPAVIEGAPKPGEFICK